MTSSRSAAACLYCSRKRSIKWPNVSCDRRTLSPLLRRRVAAQADFGVQLAGNLPSAGRLYRRHLAEDEAPGPSTNLVLINPRTRPASAHTHAEARFTSVSKNIASVTPVSSLRALTETGVRRMSSSRWGTRWEAGEAVFPAVPRRAFTGRFDAYPINHGNLTIDWRLPGASSRGPDLSVETGAIGPRTALGAVGSAADDGTVPREQSCSREIRVGAARSDVARGSLAARRIEPSLPNRDGRSTVAHVRRIFGIYDWQRARTQRSNRRDRRLAVRQAKTSDCVPPWARKLARIRFVSEALREAGIDLYRWRHAVEAEIGADVELHVRDDDPRERHIEAHLGGLDHGVIVIVRP